ncbi:MAG: AMP-binding protein [Deltaproteobacteria bacterium]|nr:AMP-binding protein [Deltaproteobacteria bacterium]
MIEDTLPETIPALLASRVVATGGEQPWIRTERGEWTVRDAATLADRLAFGLAERGVVRGDRVAILTGNREETVFAWLAANRLGAIAVPMDPASRPAELGALLAHCRARVVVLESDDVRARVLAGVGETSRSSVVTPEELASSGSDAPDAAVEPEDVAVLVYTSGTTGRPKAVMQTHRTYVLTAEAYPSWLGLGSADHLYGCLPLFHINAQAYATMGSLWAGIPLTLVERFSASRFWGDVARSGATALNAVGAMIHILLARPESAADRAHRLRLVYAALALPEPQHRAFEERFGVQMIVGYGMSESTFGTVWPRGVTPRHGTMGTLRQHPRLGAINRARVVRDDGSDAAPDEPGELWLSNPATMRGYWEDEAATRATLVDGWLRTGDLVRRDADGWYTFVSRIKDVLRRRGHNVAPAEIEAALLEHPSVAEAAVIGTPSALGEDDLVAFVAPRAGETCAPDTLLAWLRDRLSAYKVPDRIEVRDALPKTATERIAKHLLR